MIDRTWLRELVAAVSLCVCNGFVVASDCMGHGRLSHCDHCVFTRKQDFSSGKSPPTRLNLGSHPEVGETDSSYGMLGWTNIFLSTITAAYGARCTTVGAAPWSIAGRRFRTPPWKPCAWRMSATWPNGMMEDGRWSGGAEDLWGFMWRFFVYLDLDGFRKVCQRSPEAWGWFGARGIQRMLCWGSLSRGLARCDGFFWILLIMRETQ